MGPPEECEAGNCTGVLMKRGKSMVVHIGRLCIVLIGLEPNIIQMTVDIFLYKVTGLHRLRKSYGMAQCLKLDFVDLVKRFFSESRAFFAQRLSSRLVASLCFCFVGKLKCLVHCR